ncbi:MAG: hypothetical protein ACRDTJ_13975, partial [Pseudonocardiaceae bacterium]
FEARALSAPQALGTPEGFVPYVPPPKSLGAGAATAAAAELGEVAVRRALPGGPKISDPGLREEYAKLPDDKKARWVPLAGYPTAGTALDKARFYADKLGDDDLDIPAWQKDVVSGRWYNFAVDHEHRAAEVTVARYSSNTDQDTGATVWTKDGHNFVDGLGEGEVHSNKYTQIGDHQASSFERHINEFNAKYDTGRPDLRIADTPANRARVARGELDPDELAQPLDGVKVLFIPPQKNGIPDWAHEYAARKGITIREVPPHPDAGDIE